MKSKKYLSLIALAIGLGSCTNDLADETTPITGQHDVIAVAIDDASSRTAMDGVNVVWSAEDAIGVFVGSTNNKYVLQGEGGTTSGDFGSDGLVVGGTKEVAYFPYVEGATWKNGVITTTLPATYEYAEGTNNNAIMAALMDADAQSSISFQNAGALYAITVENIPAGYDKAVMTYLDADNKVGIAGAATISFNDAGEPTLAVADADNAVKAVTITSIGSGNKTFYFPMPVKTEGYAGMLQFSLQGEGKEAIEAPVFTKEPVRNKLYSVTLKLDNVSGGIVTEANDIVAANTELAKDAVTSVTVNDATDDTPITIPAKSEASAAVAHTIDLSGATLPDTGSVGIVVEEGTGEKTTVTELTVIVPEGANAGSYTINAPGTTVTIQGANGTVIETIEATTAPNTLIIGEGVTIKNLTIKKGNVELYGKLEKFTSEVATTIKLMKDIDLTSVWEITQSMDVTLDLNNYKLTTSQSVGTADDIIVQGKLNILNGTIETSNTAFLVKDGGELKLDECDIISNAPTAVAMSVKGNSKLEATDCTVTTKGSSFRVRGGSTMVLTNCNTSRSEDGTGKTPLVLAEDQNTILTISGGSYTSKAYEEVYDAYVIGVKNGANATINTTVSGGNGGVTVIGASTANLTGGSYSGVKACGLYINGESTVTGTNNCTFSGVEGAIVVGPDGGTVDETKYTETTIVKK